MKKQLRQRLILSGQVQGVGFRPFVFRLATRLGLGGSVLNSSQGLVIEIQGAAEDLAAFKAALRRELPQQVPLARISGWHEEDLAIVPVDPGQRDRADFKILNSAPNVANIANTESCGQAGEGALAGPDLATCADCLREMNDPADRRFGYAFINCTNCGPRYSIIRNLPYDRPATSLAAFAMCPDCAAEYANPADRRFHAQPNACPVCGPQIWFCAVTAPATGRENCPQAGQALALAVQSLLRGEILALKGLGGFHLACDASNEAAVAELRRRKARPHKPLAVMAANLQQAAAWLDLDDNSRALLLAPERPIVLCPRREFPEPGLPGSTPGLTGRAQNLAAPSPDLTAPAQNLAPDSRRLGLMLPYTPLHHLLLAAVGRPLVMTSGNRGGDPIALGNREALARLGGRNRLADCFLLHDRDILTRQDDSVILPLPQSGAAEQDEFQPDKIFLRRSRGFVPAPLPLPRPARPVLALGAELKNTVCLTRGRAAFVSQHIGDLQNLDNLDFQAESCGHLARLLRVEPELLVIDSHPARSATVSGNLPESLISLPRKILQHHFAHAEAVLAENAAHPLLRQEGKALVLALDGTGYALDEQGRPELWGGELLLLDYGAGAQGRHRRLGSLTRLDLPGGEAAVLQPWRIAQALLYRQGLLEAGRNLPWLAEQIGQTDQAGQAGQAGRAGAAALIGQMLDQNLNTPQSSGCGRVFDAAAALLGLCLEISYEGQAAMRLEAAAVSAPQASQLAKPERSPQLAQLSQSARVPRLRCPLLRPGAEAVSDLLLLDTRTLLGDLFLARQAGAGLSELAWAFHEALAEGLAELALAGAEAAGCRCLGLSGGVMQNSSLFLLLSAKLRQRGLVMLAHRNLPPNDGCISYGQAVFGAADL